jgi:hypothetical protein
MLALGAMKIAASFAPKNFKNEADLSPGAIQADE